MSGKRVSVAQAAGSFGADGGGEASFFKRPAAPAPEVEEVVTPGPAAPAAEREPVIDAPVQRPGFQTAAAAAAAEAESERTVAQERPRAQGARPPRPARKPRAPRPARPVEQGDLVACQLYVPEDVLLTAQRLLRPAATGARRTITKTMMVGAYARAIHNLGLVIDTAGLERGMDDEATRRVERALAEHFGVED